MTDQIDFEEQSAWIEFIDNLSSCIVRFMIGHEVVPGDADLRLLIIRAAQEAI